ncbi:DnaJ domain-containing protein [Pseudobutyrivibrio sp. OR37]|uniref:J domain-containing protein n=1 Tax=Pseudobutyrivibrio sp. OR37 TaxID=1798186 RepID=UPI0008E76B00|nr:DnaJ domain-containing protein [Pseudobutyrivibrio sp. OR37]SFH64772.1 DnaJ domain-containing protein [Pseudobutyrivibrio sp. OR37]
MIKTRHEALMALGLGPNASQVQIKNAYKDLVKKCHPDVTGNADATIYNRITEAYQFLCKDNGGAVLTHSRVVGKTSKRNTASNADYAAFQKKAKEAKERRKQEFEQKQKDFSAMYEKQEADYKRAMEAIDAIRVARAIQSMVWANGMEKDWDDNKE